MSIGKTASNKNVQARVRMLDGKKVVATFFNGRATSEGKYLAGMVDDQLVLDANGRPVPFHQIGELVNLVVKKK